MFDSDRDRVDTEGWHELLNRVHRAERDRDRLLLQVLHDHEDMHTGNARWCLSPACRIAAAHVRW